MKKFFAVLAAMVIAVAFSTAAWAGNISVTAQYWRVTDIWNTHNADGVLIGRKIRFSRDISPKDIYVQFLPDDPAWSEIKKIEIDEWIWLNTGPGKKVQAFFDRNRPAHGGELDDILD